MGGDEVSEFYRPSSAEFAQVVSGRRRAKSNLRDSTQMPGGWGLAIEKHLKVKLPRNEVPRFRRIYGYVGTAQSTD